MDIPKNNIENSTLGDRIKYILKYENIKSIDLANSIDVKPSHISQVIHNKKKLSYRTLKRISETYNISLDWLLYGKGNIYIDKDKYNQILRKIIIIFNSLQLEYQEEALEHFESLYKLQTKHDKAISEAIEEANSNQSSI